MDKHGYHAKYKRSEVQCYNTVVVSDGRSFKRHVDHLHKRTVADVTDDDPPENNRDDCLPPPTIVNDSNSILPDAPPL